MRKINDKTFTCTSLTCFNFNDISTILHHRNINNPNILHKTRHNRAYLIQQNIWIKISIY